MKTIQSQRQVFAFLAATALLATYIVLSPGPANDWVLDPLTGLVAAVTAFVLSGRMALDAPTKTVRQLWLVVVAVLGLVCISQFAEPFSEHIESYLGIDSVDDCLVLVAAPILLVLTARFDPIPTATRRVLWIAFAFQVAGTLLDLRDDAASGNAATSLVSDLADLLTMQLYLLGAALFLASLRRQNFVAHKHPSNVGDVGRYLFFRRMWYRRHRYPRLGRFVVPCGRAGLWIGRFFVWFLNVSAPVAHSTGRTRGQQFRDILAVGFRHGLDAQAYYMFELYQEPARRQAAGFLTRYETKNGLFKMLTQQLPKGLHRTPLGDKLLVQELCERNRIPHVPVLVAAEGGRLDMRCGSPEALMRDLFIKPRRLKGARGTAVLRHDAGMFVTGDGTRMSLQDVLAYVAHRSAEDPLLVQPYIRNHPGIADLADQSLIAIRVITCLNELNEPVVTHGMLRVLCKLEPGWSTSVELGAPVNLHSGTLGRMAGDKAEMLLDWCDDHPITGARVRGRILPYWDEIRGIAVAAHAACKDRLLIGWDIAIERGGPLVLEGNAYADVDFLQRVHRCSIGASPLGGLLFNRLMDLERRMEAKTLAR
jgi:hypothetical protein